MIRARATIVAALLVLVACWPARGEAPPPDPSRGDSYDGREHPPGWREDAKLVPRLVLAPVRLAFRALAVPVQKLLDWDEENRVHETIFVAFSSHDRKRGLRPAFQYSISFSPIAGLRYFDQKLLGPSTNLESTFMIGGIDIIYADLHLRPTPSDRALQASLDVVFNRRNDQVFTGIGFVDEDEEILPGSRYAVDGVEASGTATLAVAPGLYLDGTTGFGVRRFGNGRQIGDEKPIDEVYCLRAYNGLCIPGTVNELLVPGFNQGTQFVRAGVAIRVDSRDNWYRPSSGALVEVGADWSHGLGFDESHYLRLHGALSAVLDLWQRSRTLVLRVEANDIQPFGTTPVPFSELIVLGGPDTFRGFRPGRFRNYSSLFAGIEYRWPIWMWMDATIFAEYGGVFGQGFQGFSIERMRPDLGAGVRLRSSDTFFARAQFAYGWGDRWQFFFSVNVGM